MTTHLVSQDVERDQFLHIEGHTPILLLYMYPAGDCDVPKTWHMLYSALYDVHQCHDGMATGDTIAWADGTVFARVESFHVIPVMNPYFATREQMARYLPNYIRKPWDKEVTV